MKFEFIRASNGLVLEISQEGMEIDRIIYQESDNEDQEIERFKDFLCELVDSFGPPTSRYSKKRTYVTIEPGDKHE